MILFNTIDNKTKMILVLMSHCCLQK